jgi:hypothetical protein
MMKCPKCGADAKYQWGMVYDVLCYDEKGYVISSPEDANYHCDNGHDFGMYLKAGGEPEEKGE